MHVRPVSLLAAVSLRISQLYLSCGAQVEFSPLPRAPPGVPGLARARWPGTRRSSRPPPTTTPREAPTLVTGRQA
jgi:hypothetical protein